MKIIKTLLAVVITVYIGISFFVILPFFILHFSGIEKPFIIWECVFDYLLEQYNLL